MVAGPILAGLEPPALLRKYFGPDLDQRIESWPPDKVRAYQTEALAEQIDHAYRHNRFYRRKLDAAARTPADLRTPEDLGRFPFTSKEELRGDPWVLLSVPREQVRLAHTSTGTTGGAWSYILYSREDMYAGDTVPRVRALMPVQPGDVVINALPYEMSSSGQSFQRSLQEGSGALVLPVGKGGFYSDPYKTVRIMADLRADVLITTPPYAMLLWELARQEKLLPQTAIPLRFIWLTGEGCSRSYRRRLEQQWGCPALIFYGSMECGSIAIECSVQNGSHLCAGHVYVEIVDPRTGDPQPPGNVGELVCTVLQRRASPLIRFRTQDLAFLDVSACACGIRFPRLHVVGRIADQWHAAEQRVTSPVSPYLIEEVLYSQPEMGNNYQIYTDGSALLIDAEGGEGARDKARERIVALLRERGVTAELCWVEHIPRVGGKTRRMRPLAEREQVMNSASLLHRAGP